MDIYLNLSYDQYKALEQQLLEWKKRETAHTSVDGFYHKSISFRIDDTRFEFHGPNVKAAEPEALSSKQQAVLRGVDVMGEGRGAIA